CWHPARRSACRPGWPDGSLGGGGVAGPARGPGHATTATSGRGRRSDVPVEMSRERFEELVRDALDEIPGELLDLMDNVVILVEDEAEGDTELLGLYEGHALTERGWHYGGVLPDRITIYRNPILRLCSTEEEVVEEVAITVVHEIAHHFGIDDERLHELGWA